MRDEWLDCFALDQTSVSQSSATCVHAATILVENPTMQTSATSVRYQIVLVSIFMSFILYLDRVCLGEIVKSKAFLTETNYSEQQIGTLLASFFLMYALFQVPAGWASDRFGARRMLTIYISVWSLLTMLTGFSRSFAEMRIARQGLGIAQAGAYPTSGGLIRNWFPVHARGQISGLVTFGGRLGGALAPLLTTSLMLWLGGWRVVLGLYGVLGLFIAAAYWIFVRDRPAECEYCNDAERELLGIREPERRPELGELPGLLLACTKSLSLWSNSACQFLVNVGWAFLINWLPSYLKKVKHVDDLTGAWMVTLVLSAGIVGQLFGGYVADLSVRRIGLRWGRSVPMSIGCVVAGITYLLCLIVDSPWGIVGLCLIVSLSTDICNPSTWAFMQDIGGRNTAAIIGWGNMWGNFGAAFSAIMVPWLRARGGTVFTGEQLVFLACAGAFFLSGLLAFGMNPTKPVLVSEG